MPRMPAPASPLSAPLGACMIAMLCAVPAVAQSGGEKGRERTPLFEKLVECRTIAEDAKRLQCYDAQVAAIDEAEKRDEVVVVDREEIRKTRRSLFGLKLADLGIFGGGSDDEGKPEEEGVTKIEGVIRAVAMTRDGKFLFTLDDGARWQATEPKVTGRSPKAGDPIIIRRGPLGSFSASINGRAGIKVIRLN